MQMTLITTRCNAERGIATASRLSVCLSLCNVDVSWSHWVEFSENNFTVS